MSLITGHGPIFCRSYIEIDCPAAGHGMRSQYHMISRCLLSRKHVKRRYMASFTGHSDATFMHKYAGAVTACSWLNPAHSVPNRRSWNLINSKFKFQIGFANGSTPGWFRSRSQQIYILETSCTEAYSTCYVYFGTPLCTVIGIYLSMQRKLTRRNSIIPVPIFQH